LICHHRVYFQSPISSQSTHSPPQLPGYGDSTPSTKGHDKRTISATLLEALSASLPPSPTPQKILLAGHDRGARVIHRLAVDAALHPSFTISSLILLDIVPTLTQWSSFTSAPGITSTFHWPFLANADMATELIMAKGGSWWCQSLIHRWAGTNDKRLYMLEEGAAMQIYGDHFDKESVVRASCEDYKAGATVDVDIQKGDQEAGRKIKVPALILFSATYLGARYDVKGIWREWVDEGVEVRAEGIGDGCGHFLPEEAPHEVAGLMKSWMEGMGLRWPGLKG
jgi:pimeloyl-ACP methyl ester carboxylesterase